jgi:hypothetical protein
VTSHVKWFLYSHGMARRGSDNITVRMGADLWRAFGEVAEPDRSAVVREFIRWYVREPGAKMPHRPISRGPS